MKKYYKNGRMHVYLVNDLFIGICYMSFKPYDISHNNSMMYRFENKHTRIKLWL